MGSPKTMLKRIAVSGAARASIRVGAKSCRMQPLCRTLTTEAEAYQSLVAKQGFFGSALEQPPNTYDNSIHEQDELWWDDGTAVREPIFDSDYIPLSEAVPMFFGGFALFAAVAGIHYGLLDPAANRPTVPREMPEAHIWESYGKAAAGVAADEEDDDGED